MDNSPMTRQEKKGGKKQKDKSIYSSKHVRQMEARQNQKKDAGTGSSTSKTPPTSADPSSSKPLRR